MFLVGAKRSPDLPPDRPPVLPSDRDFNRGLKWSLGFHVGVIALVLIKSLVFPDTPKQYIPSLRVDVVGLPDVLKKDLKNAPSTKEVSEILKKAAEEAKKIKPKKMPPLPPPKEIAKPDEMVLKPKPQTAKNEKAREKRLKAALDRMKALAKISGEEKKVNLYKGNKISKGTSADGESNPNDANAYYASVLQRLQENWALDKYLSRQNLSAQVQIFIDAHGRLHNFRFVKVSGNSQFDDAVKRALEESAPFPMPPVQISASVLVNGITFGFPL